MQLFRCHRTVCPISMVEAFAPPGMLDDALLIEPEPYGSFVRPLWNSLIWYSLIPAESRPVSATDQ
jgi:hypothetical protein